MAMSDEKIVLETKELQTMEIVVQRRGEDGLLVERTVTFYFAPEASSKDIVVSFDGKDRVPVSVVDACLKEFFSAHPELAID
jgi:hypothetical protein